ncbi:lambda-exonuclease family protein [Clostridium sp. HBUAS56017]|uniref:YqaJ viral recombinase family nuclease n=1 Tax=Clostridium sp. HBUAS56017 TaxID=2571128 RepID=UPI001FAA9D11|nr:YqaJ viral recombinase family protein [Clostridium sp. HBUAS56017]
MDTMKFIRCDNGKALGVTGEGKVKVIENKDIFPTAKVVFDSREDSEDRKHWLEQRVNSIGGSEIGAIAGYSKYASPLTVFNDKLGLVDKFKGNIHTKFGTRMEPYIREWIQDDFEEDTGIALKTYEYPYMMIDREIPYFSANIDGLGLLENQWKYRENRDTGEFWSIEPGELFGLEIKTGSEFLKRMWTGEDIPDTYYCQIQWYMGVTGLKHFLIIYLLGKEVKWKVIPRDEDDIKALRNIGQEFWTQHIIQKVAPSPTGLAVETDQIKEQQALNDIGVVNILDEKLSNYQKVSDEIKELEQQKEKLKQEIFLDLGNAQKGTDGLYKVSRFQIKRDTLDNKLLKEKYPLTYESVLKGSTEYVNMRITKCK